MKKTQKVQQFDCSLTNSNVSFHYTEAYLVSEGKQLTGKTPTDCSGWPSCGFSPGKFPAQQVDIAPSTPSINCPIHELLTIGF